MDQTLFKERLVAIAEFYGKSLNPFVITAYYERLRNLSDREFEAACKYAINEYQFMPPASKLYEAVRESNEAQMHSEWAIAIKAASKAKRLCESGLNEMACHAIKRMGGLYLIGSMSDRDAQWKKKEFAELYREAVAMAATGFLPALSPTPQEEIKALPEVSDEEARENVEAIAAMLRNTKGRRKALEKQFQQGHEEFEELPRSAFDSLGELTDEAISATVFEDGRIGTTPQNPSDPIYTDAYADGMSAHARDNGVEVRWMNAGEEAIDLGWMRWTREESNDEFHEEYRGFNIYLAIPNGGICGGSIIEINSKKKAWVYMTEHLDNPRYHDTEWHVNQCRLKIDELLEKWEEKPNKTRKSKRQKAEGNGQLTLNLEVRDANI